MSARRGQICFGHRTCISRTDRTDGCFKFCAENMSKRLADNLCVDIAESGEIKVAEGESVMAQVMLEIRRLIDLGEINLITPSKLEQDS